MTNKKIALEHGTNTSSVELVTSMELDAFFGLLLYAGLHHSNNEEISELWGTHSLPLFRAAMPKNRFKEILSYIRFDDGTSRSARIKQDKTAAISEIFGFLNGSLQKYYKPSESLTVDEQLYAYRGRFRFKQFIPSKPAKYGVKTFFINDARNGYPLQGIIYAGKEEGAERKTNVGANIVLDLAKPYRKSGRNITADNFFVNLYLAENLNKMNLTLVGTVRKSKRFLPPSMLPSRDRAVKSTNFAFQEKTMLCSYVPKKNKAVVLLSTMHSKPEVEDNEAKKPALIMHYNATKGGTDTMDAMLSRFSCKRKTNRWSLAYFFNMLDIAALAAYIVFKENNPKLNLGEPRRTFLRELAFQLCMPAIEARRKNNLVYGKQSVKVAIDYFCVSLPHPTTAAKIKEGNADTKDVIKSCKICQQLQKEEKRDVNAISATNQYVLNIQLW